MVAELPRYGIKAIAKDGVGFASVAPVLAGLAVGAAFVDRQRRLAAPMIDLGLFRRPTFSLALSANTLAFAVVFGIEVFVAQYFQLVLGYSPLTPPLAARVRLPVVMLGGSPSRSSASHCSPRRKRPPVRDSWWAGSSSSRSASRHSSRWPPISRSEALRPTRHQLICVVGRWPGDLASTEE